MTKVPPVEKELMFVISKTIHWTMCVVVCWAVPSCFHFRVQVWAPWTSLRLLDCQAPTADSQVVSQVSKNTSKHVSVLCTHVLNGQLWNHGPDDMGQVCVGHIRKNFEVRLWGRVALTNLFLVHVVSAGPHRYYKWPAWSCGPQSQLFWS